VNGYGAATSWFLSFYDAALRGDDTAEMNRPYLFNTIALAPTAKAWIDRTGKITYGDIPAAPPNP
jgi:hypothetical protein